MINQIHSCKQLEFIAKIIDFGGAIQTNDQNDRDATIGPIPFADPKFLSDSQNYKKNFKSDSLGVVFWVGFVLIFDYLIFLNSRIYI